MSVPNPKSAAIFPEARQVLGIAGLEEISESGKSDHRLPANRGRKR